MTARYTVAENQHGYELHDGMLRYAIIDNATDFASVYRPIERALVLQPKLDGPKQRQIAFCKHREDAENLAGALNLVEELRDE